MSGPSTSGGSSGGNGGGTSGGNGGGNVGGSGQPGVTTSPSTTGPGTSTQASASGEPPAAFGPAAAVGLANTGTDLLRDAEIGAALVAGGWTLHRWASRQPERASAPGGNGDTPGSLSDSA